MNTEPPPRSSKDVRNNPLVNQIKQNLSPGSIRDIIRGGPKRWGHVGNQIRINVSPEAQKHAALKAEKEIAGEIKKAGLKPMVFKHEYGGTSIASVGCELPVNKPYQLRVSVKVNNTVAPELDAHLGPGRYLKLPATTSDDMKQIYFNNGFYIFTPGGHPRQVTEKIEPFKGALKIAFRPGEKSGKLDLLSPEETQRILSDSEIARKNLPNGGILLGAPLFTEVNPQNQHTILDAAKILASNRYLSTYNSELPFYMQIGERLYYISNILENSPGPLVLDAIRHAIEEIPEFNHLDKDFLHILQDNPSRLLLGTFAALQTAATIAGNQPARIALVEQNVSGRPYYIDNKDPEHYPTFPLIALKLS